MLFCISIRKRKGSLHTGEELTVSPEKRLVACGSGREVSAAPCPSPRQPDPGFPKSSGKRLTVSSSSSQHGDYRIIPLSASPKKSMPPWGPGSVTTSPLPQKNKFYTSASQCCKHQTTGEIAECRFLGFLPDSGSGGRGEAQEFAFLTCSGCVLGLKTLQFSLSHLNVPNVPCSGFTCTLGTPAPHWRDRRDLFGHLR